MDHDPKSRPLPALTPKGAGHQFVLYGDSCSGVAGGRHERAHARVNSVVRRFSPPPEFIVYPGDEILGLTGDAAELRRQWTHWLDVEMAWCDRAACPLYNTTGNHTTYDAMSEGVFAEMLGHLPRNGPADQQGLSYVVRRGDLLLVCVNTLWSGLGGEGHVETDWLARTLADHEDARWKFVAGHHPAFAVNGFSGDCARQIAADCVGRFWEVLVENRVFAYLCSHILAFDVQVQTGVLQITTAGAGTVHRMPEGVEYLHCVQAAIDERGLRYQVLDDAAAVRERLVWPPVLPDRTQWRAMTTGWTCFNGPDAEGCAGGPTDMTAWRIRGFAGADPRPQTLFCTSAGPDMLPSLWVGLSGRDRKLTVTLAPEAGRSPHYWFGPALGAGEQFDVELAVHRGMGPGGIIWRPGPDAPWTTLRSASSWGAERLRTPQQAWVGHGPRGGGDTPFCGAALEITTGVAESDDF